MYSALMTVKLWRLNARTWLSAYLQACADNGNSAISSRNSVPPSAALNRPSRFFTAPVKAPQTLPTPPSTAPGMCSMGYVARVFSVRKSES